MASSAACIPHKNSSPRPGTAREALTFYGDVFDCEVHLHTFTEFNRDDGPADAIAHGYLAGGPVAIFAADVSGDDQPFRCEGMMLPLLGTAEPATPRDWFSSLADGGQIVDDLHKRPWGPPTGRSSTDTAFIGSSGSRATKKTDRGAEAVLFLRGRMTVTRRAGVQATPTPTPTPTSTSTSRVNHHLSHTGSPLLSTGVLRRSRSGVPCCLTSIPPGSCGSAQAVSPSARWRRRECEQFAV